MPSTEIVFSPKIDERQLDRETERVDDRLQQVGQDVPVSFDTDDLDGLSPAGSGGGGGSLTTGAAAGGGAKLASKIPKPVAGVTASAAIPVALAGGGFLALDAIHDSLSGASAELQQVNSMFGTAIEQFRAPFGDALAGALRPSADSLLEAGVEFREAAREQGFGSAFQQLGQDFFAPRINELSDPIRSQTDVLEDIQAGGQAGAVAGGIFGGSLGAKLGGAFGATLATALATSPLTAAAREIVNFFKGGVDAKDLFKGGVELGQWIFDGSVTLGKDWLFEGAIELGQWLFNGAITLGKDWLFKGAIGLGQWLFKGAITLSKDWLFEGAIGLGTWLFEGSINVTEFLNEFVTGSVGDDGDDGDDDDNDGGRDVRPNYPGDSPRSEVPDRDLPGTDPPESIVGGGDDDGRDVRPNYPGDSPTPTDDNGGFDPDLNPFEPGNQDASDMIPDIDLPGLQSGGRIERSGVARVHRGELVADPDRLVRDLANAVDSAAGGGGGSVDMTAVERKLDDLNRNVKRLQNAMSQEIVVDGETLGRVAQENQRERISDTDPLA